MTKISHWLFALALLPLSALAGEGAAAPSAGYDEGIEYQAVKPPQPTSTGDKVEVLEFFWYGCPHCYQFEPQLTAWLKTKPAAAEFVRMPAILSPKWELHARVYYAAEVLGVVDKMHAALFEAIHAKKQPLGDEAALVRFFADHGVAEKDFRSALHSFVVDSKVRRARLMTERYAIDGVPAMIVNGKYRTSGTIAGGNAGMLKVVDFLIHKESTLARNDKQ